MARVTFITGGQRSGKSSYAMKLAEQGSDNPIYLATARIWDKDFEGRVDRHKKDRGEQWQTIEEELELSKYDLRNRTVVVDCITLWLTNVFADYKFDVDASLVFAKKEWARFIAADFDLFVVSNEIGMGVHAENEVGRKFADLQGWVNQYIANSADAVQLMVSGIPVKIK